jgi:hypothetical protein
MSLIVRVTLRLALLVLLIPLVAAFIWIQLLRT